MQVLHVCSEIFPLLKTGGLADVTGALPAAQIAAGIDTRVLLPAFPDLKQGIADTEVVAKLQTFAGYVELRFGFFNGVGIYLIDAPGLYDRPGSPITMNRSMPIPTTICVLRYWDGWDVK